MQILDLLVKMVGLEGSYVAFPIVKTHASISEASALIPNLGEYEFTFMPKRTEKIRSEIQRISELEGDSKETLEYWRMPEEEDGVTYFLPRKFLVVFHPMIVEPGMIRCVVMHATYDDDIHGGDAVYTVMKTVVLPEQCPEIVRVLYKHFLRVDKTDEDFEDTLITELPDLLGGITKEPKGIPDPQVMPKVLPTPQVANPFSDIQISEKTLEIVVEPKVLMFRKVLVHLLTGYVLGYRSVDFEVGDDTSTERMSILGKTPTPESNFFVSLNKEEATEAKVLFGLDYDDIDAFPPSVEMRPGQIFMDHTNSSVITLVKRAGKLPHVDEDANPLPRMLRANFPTVENSMLYCWIDRYSGEVLVVHPKQKLVSVIGRVIYHNLDLVFFPSELTNIFTISKDDSTLGKSKKL